MNNITRSSTYGKIKDYKDRIALQEAEAFKQQQEYDKALNEKNDMVKASLEGVARKRKYSQWKNTIKEALLAEAMMSIVNKSFNKIYSEDARFNNLKNALVYNFIREEGATKLLEEFKYKSDLLAQYAMLIESTYHEITDKTSDVEYSIDPEVKDRFYEKLANANISTVTNKICDRVQDAVETFVTQNANNREEIRTVLQQTQEKIDAAQQKVPATTTDVTAAEEAADAYSQIANRKIRMIEERTANIFDELAYNACRNLYNLPADKRKEFTLENGKLDMEAVMESCKVIYTFLETLNTTKIHEFTPEELESLVENVYK